MVYELINNMYETCSKEGMIVVQNYHNHTDNCDYANVIKIFENDGSWFVTESTSGGKNECVWNTQCSEHDNFIDAFKSAIEIEPLHIMEAYFTVLDFLERRGRISFKQEVRIKHNIRKHVFSDIYGIDD